IERRERVRYPPSRRDAELLEQRFADEMRRLVARGTDAQIDARLAIVHRQKLRVTVGEMQEAYVAERRNRVEVGAVSAFKRTRIGDIQPGNRGGGHGLQEFAAVH